MFPRGLSTLYLVLTLLGCDAQLSRLDQVRVVVSQAPDGTDSGEDDAGSDDADGGGDIEDDGGGDGGSDDASVGDDGGESETPTVDAGADLITNQAFERTGKVLSGEAATIKWEKASGPGTLTFSAPDALTTEISASVSGIYVVKLTVTNASGQSGSASFTLNWDEDPPTPPAALRTAADSASGDDVRFDNDTTFYLVWSAADDGAGAGIRDYTVHFYSAAGCGGAAQETTGVTATSLEVSGVAGQTYSFRVTAFDKLGQGAQSACSGSMTIDMTPPAALDDFQASTGSTVQSISVTVDFPAGHDYARVDVRRTLGAIPPADCHSGVVAKSYSGAFPDPDTFVDDTGGAGQAHSYRVCIYDEAGNETSSDTITNVVAKPHIVFATSTTFDGTLGGDPGGGETGVARADARCVLAAQGSVLGDVSAEPVWRAIIADDQTDAVAHVIVTGLVTASDGTDVVTDRANMWDGDLDLEILLDENGLASAEVWTGADASGLRTMDTCGSWSTTAGNGQVGDARQSNSSWIAMASQSCALSRSIYCISQPAEKSFEAFTATTGSSAGRIDLMIDPDDDITYIDRIEIRRAIGGTAPDANCASGTLVTTLTGITGVARSVTDSGLAAGTYSYRACAFDAYDNVLTTATRLSVSAN